MKSRILTILLSIILGFPLTAMAQGRTMADILAAARGHRVEAEYSYVISGMTDISIDGKAVVQDSCFRLEGAGLIILSDGKDTWTLDLDGREAYVENAGPFDYLQYLADAEVGEDGSISGTFGEPMSGALIPFTISNIRILPWSGDLSVFSPAKDAFSGDWIITDLR